MRTEYEKRIAQDATYPENRDTALVPADTLSVGDVLTYDRRFPRPKWNAEREVFSVAHHDRCVAVVVVRSLRQTPIFLKPDALVRVLVPQDGELSARQEAQERPDA